MDICMNEISDACLYGLIPFFEPSYLNKYLSA